ncbi:MAG: peptidylprolyl isomerase [Lentisphaeria bacterium]|nr:peptidylprolyl isomerase [Lentisphaeria bacterium]
MIIQKMNNVLVKHGKVTFAIFTAVIIVSFVWFFTPGVDGSLLFGGNVGMGSQYGAVLGHKVTYGDVSSARQVVSMVRAATYGLAPHRVQSPDEDASFQAALLIKAADVMNIQASDKEVAEVIHSMPSFQNADNKFSKELYEQYKDLHLAPSGLGFSDLEEAVRTIIRMEKVPTVTSSNVIVTDDEAKTEIEGLLQKITYHMITFDHEAFKDQVKLEDAEIRDFYTANPGLFMSEPESDGLLAFAAYTEKKNELTDDQLKDYYDANKALFTKADGTEQAFDDVKDDIRKEIGTTVEREDAEKKAEAFNKSFREAIRADKEAFEADPQKLFREEAEKAGLKISEVKNLTRLTEPDDGLHIDGQLVGAVTELKNVGSYTKRLYGEHGVSMFLMTARRPAVVQPFEDVKETAEKRLLAQREYALADEAASQLALKALELKYAPAEIEEFVKSLKGTWHAEATRTRYDVEANPYLPCSNEVLTTNVGKLSSPDKSFGDPAFVFVTAHTPATAEEIAEKKESLELELKYRKREVVSRGLQGWIIESATVVNRGRTQE